MGRGAETGAVRLQRGPIETLLLRVRPPGPKHHWELVRHADSQLPRIRICVLTRSPGDSYAYLSLSI